MVELVDRQQVLVALELGQVKLGRGRDRLVRGDVALQAAAGIGSVLGRPHGQAVSQGRTPYRVDERLFRLKP